MSPHALLMDDDIVIEPEALVKTYQILTLLKDEYEDAFIGGAMLRLDKPGNSGRVRSFVERRLVKILKT